MAEYNPERSNDLKGNYHRPAAAIKSEKKRFLPDVEFFRILEAVIRMSYNDKNFNVDELARIFRVSLSHFRERVRSYYGFPPHFLIENIRLENSFYLLMLDFEIYDIAQEVGFNNAQSYRRSFKRRLNMCPTEFKKLLLDEDENKQIKLNFFKDYLWNDKKSAILSGDIAP